MSGSNEIIGVFGLLGSFAGAISLGWRLLDMLKAFLHIGITVEPMRGQGVKVRTVVENRNSKGRKLDAAFLVVGPESEGPEEIVQILLAGAGERLEFKNQNEMVMTVTERIKEGNQRALADNVGRMIIPLPYYYLENYRIADETLCYEQTIGTHNIPAGTYAVRFYIERIPRLHRVVQAIFEVNLVSAN